MLMIVKKFKFRLIKLIFYNCDIFSFKKIKYLVNCNYKVNLNLPSKYIRINI